MDFIRVITETFSRLDAAGVRYALIGGFAMAMRGVQRATVDIDLILHLEDLEQADGILREQGYARAFHSENVSHYRSEDADFGRIDILHAFRTPSLSMLERAERIEVTPGTDVPVARVEDIVGLKVQAAFNDPERATQDWLDIRMLMESSADQGTTLDWELIADYLDIFDAQDRLTEMEAWHGKAQ